MFYLQPSPWKPAKPLFTRGTYAELPGWDTAALTSSLQTFQMSCKWLVKRSPEREVGNKRIPLQAKDWLPACEEALRLQQPSETQIKMFFEQYFVPVYWTKPALRQGLFTGYFSPVYDGSLTRTSLYTVPVYEIPLDLVTVRLKSFDPKLPNRLLRGRVEHQYLHPYYTRAQIDAGAIQHKAKVLVWLKDEMDRLFLEIQGAGKIKLPNGDRIPLGYAGENGAPYHSVAGVLIKEGVLTKDNASMQRIRGYFKAHPDQIEKIMHTNPSLVFFEKLNRDYSPGSLGFPLTAGYSMAVDTRWVPLGAPVWIDTQQPNGVPHQNALPLRRLMIAQDVGGAIQGAVRGDIFWGEGREAAAIAGRMKYPGRAWVLLPKTIVERH